MNAFPATSDRLQVNPDIAFPYITGFPLAKKGLPDAVSTGSPFAITDLQFYRISNVIIPVTLVVFAAAAQFVLRVRSL